MSLQAFLEQDKERLLSAVSGADPEAAIRAVQAELDRLLFAFNDGEDDERVCEAANAMIQAAKASASLIDTAGETKIYGRTEYGAGEEEKKERRVPPVFWILLIAGIACALPLAIGYWSANRGLTLGWFPIVKLILPFAAMLLLFFAGLSLRIRRKKPKEELRAETTVDSRKVYNRLLTAVVVMDKELDGIREAEEIRRRKQLAGPGGIDDSELELMGHLLEDAYGRRASDDTAAELLSQLKFYLHKKHVDVVDFEDRLTYGKTDPDEALSVDREHRGWFDMIPAFTAGTIRPALVADGRLLKKGLASEGR
ncbi:MAG: hypothetical protein IKD88_02425 [Lachnospiraceae bacterium]|nr:hypothetical protein [Lachnospiraceae bacterium]